MDDHKLSKESIKSNIEYYKSRLDNLEIEKIRILSEIQVQENLLLELYDFGLES